MDALVLEGGARLAGRVAVSGAKNAVLPLMCAALLTDEPLQLANVPSLGDTRLMLRLLGALGVETQHESERVALTAKRLSSVHAPYELVAQMRASFWVLGPLLAREGAAKVSLPGGCAIGTRPVDFYLDGLRQMGAAITLEDGYVCAEAKEGLQGAAVQLPAVSVGATHVLMLAATLARGRTTITPAAREPEVVFLGEALNAMGARVQGLGTATLTVEGVSRLGGLAQTVMADRIEAGAYALAGAQGEGEILLEGVAPAELGALLPLLKKMGAGVDEHEHGVLVRACAGRVRACDIATAPFPGFPTDLQAPFMAAMTLADGTSHIRETIFENRFMHVSELARMGAQIALDGDMARVEGVETLRGATVTATDLRASMSLVLAALRARGTTTIRRIYHLDRGFSQLEKKLERLGARVRRVPS